MNTRFTPRSWTLLLLSAGGLACALGRVPLGAAEHAAEHADGTAAAFPPEIARVVGASSPAAKTGDGERRAVAVERSPRVTDAAGDDAEPTGRAPGAFGEPTEKELHERFLLEAAGSPGALEDRAEGLLRDDGPSSRKVALLRALHDSRSARTDELFLLALRELPDVSRPQGESVPSFALVFLDRRAPRDASARSLLRRAAFERPHAPSGLRRRAAASFFSYATAAELQGARGALARESDPLVLESALEALSRNPNTETAAGLLALHGRPPPRPVAERAEP